jgi:DNA-directed RNA polymerase omega subunit
MIHPRIDELMSKVDSRYALVIVAAKRARQINNYHHQLGDVRRVRAAADRVALEELPDDGPRRDRRGQDRLRVPQVRQEVGALAASGVPYG